MARNSKLKTQHSTLPAYAGLVRWAFTRFYREFAWTYDAVAAGVSGGQWPRWTLAALPFLRGQVLELGCGTGIVQQALSAQPVRAVGLDRSRQMLQLTKRRCTHAGQSARLALADAGVAPFATATFDTLLATFPSEYIVAPTTIAECRRLLRPGGQVVILLAAQFHGVSFYHRVIDGLYRVTLQRPILAPQQPSSPDSIVGRRFRDAGFAVREFWHPFAHSGVDLHMIIVEVQG